MQAQNKQLEIALLSSDKLSKFLSSDAANVTQICSAKFESSLRRIALQAISKKDVETVCHILRVTKHLAIQNYEKGIHVVIRAGLSAVLDKILSFISNLPVKDQYESREVVLKLFLENVMLIAPMLHDHCKWLKGSIPVLLTIVHKSFLQLQVTNMTLDHLNQIMMSLPRQDVYALRSVVSGATNTMSLCKSMMCDLGLLGDYQTQTSLIELLVRITPSNLRHKSALEWSSNDTVLGQLFSQITYEAFDQTVRRYLMAVNDKRPNSVVSYPLQSVRLGDDLFDTQCWADLCFPSSKLTLSFTLSADCEESQICESLDAASVEKCQFEDSEDTLTVTLTSRIPLRQVFGDDVVHSDSYVMMLLLDKCENSQLHFEELLSTLLGEAPQEGSSSPVVMKQSLPREGVLSCNRTARTGGLPSQLDRSFSQDVVLTSQPKESKPINVLPLQVSDRRSSSHHDRLQGRLELQQVKIIDRAKLVNESLQDSQSEMSQSSFKKTSRPTNDFTAGVLKEIVPETQTGDISRDTSCHLHLSQLHAMHQEEIVKNKTPGNHDSHQERARTGQTSCKPGSPEELHIPELLSHSPCTSTDAAKTFALEKISSVKAPVERVLSRTICGDSSDNASGKAPPGSNLVGEVLDSSCTIPPSGGQLQGNSNLKSLGEDSMQRRNKTRKSQKTFCEASSKAAPLSSDSSTLKSATRSATSKNLLEPATSCQGNNSVKCDTKRKQGDRRSSRSSSGPEASVGGRSKTGKQSMSISHHAEARKKMADKVNAQFKYLEETLGGEADKEGIRKSSNLKVKIHQVFSVLPQVVSDEQVSRSETKRGTRNVGEPANTTIHGDTNKRKVGKLRRKLTAHEVAQFLVHGDADSDRESIVTNRRKRRSSKSEVVAKKPTDVNQEYNKIDADDSDAIRGNEIRKLRSTRKKKRTTCDIASADHKSLNCSSGEVEQVTSEKKLRFEFDPYSFVANADIKVSTKKKRKQNKKEKLFDCSGMSSAASTCSDLSWVRTHKASASFADVFVERPLKTFSSKRNCPLGGVLSYAAAIPEPIPKQSGKKPNVSEVWVSSSSPEIARDASPRLVIEPLSVSDCLSRSPVTAKEDSAELPAELMTYHAPHEADGCKTPVKLSTVDSILPSQCSHISLVKTPFVRRPQLEMANEEVELLTPMTGPPPQSEAPTTSSHQHSVMEHPDRGTTEETDQKLKCDAQRLNNTTPHDDHNLVYDGTPKRKRPITKRQNQRRPIGLDFGGKVGKSSKPTTDLLNSEARNKSKRQYDGRNEGKGGSDVSEPMKRACCLIMRNMAEVQEAWEDFTSKRNLKFEAQIDRMVTLSEQHNQLMRNVERLEQDSLSKLKEHQKRFDNVMDDVNRSATCMEEANVTFFDEQCCDDVGFCDVMQALSDDVTRYLNELTKTSRL